MASLLYPYLWARVLSLLGSYIYYGEAPTSGRSIHQLYLGSTDYAPEPFPCSIYPSFIPVNKELCAEDFTRYLWVLEYTQYCLFQQEQR